MGKRTVTYFTTYDQPTGVSRTSTLRWRCAEVIGGVWYAGSVRDSERSLAGSSQACTSRNPYEVYGIFRITGTYISCKIVIFTNIVIKNIMGSIEDVEFLARSANRVRALELLSADAHDRRDLVEKLGASIATINRILDGFVARGWITPDGETPRCYRATTSGTLMSDAFSSLLEEAEQARSLATVQPLLPTEDFTFDPIHLADARITLPSSVDPIAPVHRVIEQMRAAVRVRLLPVGYVAESLRANRDAVVEDGQSLAVIFKREILESIASDPTGSGYVADLLEAGSEIHYFDGSMPYSAYEADGSYAIGLVDEGGAAQALIETDDETVRAWFSALFEVRRGASVRLDRSSWTERFAPSVVA